ncbi:MAG: large-conductance mechanosensitive channel protein MscL [Clostridia bacterium]|nr:large-conductance mechanosensitive channel protein MscL [Clostridia bacterium]
MEKKGIVSEFKEFITRGNVMDMAVGIIIGGAFTAIVQSLVNDLLMPVIGALFGGIDFTTLKYVIRAADEAAGIEEAAIKYGSFIQAIVNFLLIAIVIFLLVKGINKMRRKKEEPAPAPAPDPEPSEEVKLLTEIRDALKK